MSRHDTSQPDCYNPHDFHHCASLRSYLLSENLMRSLRTVFIASLLMFSVVPLPAQTAAPALSGYSPQNSASEQQWEEKFRALPSPDNARNYMQRLSARPHHVGSAYDKDNAEWILAQFKQWGLDAQIEEFDVLFPTPKERLVELVAPTKFVAKLQEPAVAVDPTSNQQKEQLPTYNAYSADGDVTGPLVYVNYGMREDYEKLDRLGVSVKGAIVIARYGGGVARNQAEGCGGTWRYRVPDLFRSEG